MKIGGTRLDRPKDQPHAIAPWGGAFPTRKYMLALVSLKVAGAIYAERQSDATNMPDTYRPLTTPGVWVPTTPPLFPQYATAKPWGMESAS